MRRALLAAAAMAAFVGCGNDGDDAGQGAGRGKALFVERCGSCHTMRDAGTTGEALDLDYDLREVDTARVLRAIENPPPGMPSDLVRGADARAIADYVANSRTPREP